MIELEKRLKNMCEGSLATLDVKVIDLDTLPKDLIMYRDKLHEHRNVDFRNVQSMMESDICWRHGLNLMHFMRLYAVIDDYMSEVVEK